MSTLRHKSQVDREEAKQSLCETREKLSLQTQSQLQTKILVSFLSVVSEFEEKLSDVERKHRIGSEQLNVLLQYKVLT